MNIITLLDELGIDTKTGDNFDSMEVVLQRISEKWNSIKQINYLGDVRWVLYQYICNMNTDNKDVISIRCGSFAFNKLAFMPSVIGGNIAGREGFPANINGENIIVFLVPELNKKQLIISTHDFTPLTTKMIDTTIYHDDIVLYFA
ncbi:MAG TPA: hypothetical protein VIK72_17020 [Clostridiaceae bacterium]